MLGVASSGLHLNGYSLARKVLLDGHPLDARPPELSGRTIADTLLQPTRINARDLLAFLEKVRGKAFAHVTHGGLSGNVPRNLPAGMKAVLDECRWPRPPTLDLVQRGRGPARRDAPHLQHGYRPRRRARRHVAAAQELLSARGLESWVVGGVERGAGEGACEVVW